MIQDKLIQVQMDLKANKTQHNDFGNYNYRSCEDILEAVKPHLKEAGLLLTLSDDIRLIGDRFYVLATARITDGEDSFETYGFAREAAERKPLDCAQLTGSASSYARKYALAGMFLCDDNKDADALPPEKKEKDARPPEKKDTTIKDALKDGKIKMEPVYKAPAEIKCEHCGKPLQSFKDTKGNMQPQEVLAHRTKERFGQVLCIKCAEEIQRQLG